MDLTPPALDAVLRAAKLLHEGRRLDLGVLAQELGVSRVTLHRRVGSRDQLLGEALWLLADKTFARGTVRWDAAAPTLPEGTVRSLWVAEDFRTSAAADPGLQHLLASEPAVAIRILTDPRGRVQPRMIERQAVLFQHDVDAGMLDPVVDVQTLSYAVVRLGEAFLYSDVLASHAPDLAACTTLVNTLATASAPVR